MCAGGSIVFSRINADMCFISGKIASFALSELSIYGKFDNILGNLVSMIYLNFLHALYYNIPDFCFFLVSRF